jgi:hypothetical protein
MTAAAIASPLSNPLNPAGAYIGRGAGAGAADATTLGWAATRVAAAEDGGTGGAGALDAAGAGAAEAAATGAAALPAADDGGGAPGAKVGNLIVGAEVGLGGKLMRTVSFLGCTLAASAGLGGIAPPGGVGVFSAIIFKTCFQRKVAPHCCQTRIARLKASGSDHLEEGSDHRFVHSIGLRGG